jgi:hypothetical protein
MTPEEKAKELVSKFRFSYITDKNGGISVIHLTDAKQGALTCVNEILSILERVDTYKNYFETLPDMYYASSENELNYWKAVKSEIEKHKTWL